MGSDIGVFRKCRAVFDVWVHRVVEWACKDFKGGVKTCINCGCEAVCDSPLIGYFDTMPCGLSSLVRWWYLCMRCVRSVMKLDSEVCLQCCEYSHAYLSVDKRVSDTAVPEGWCTPIMCVFRWFQVLCGGTRDVYGSSRLRESLSGSLSMN